MASNAWCLRLRPSDAAAGRRVDHLAAERQRDLVVERHRQLGDGLAPGALSCGAKPNMAGGQHAGRHRHDDGLGGQLAVGGDDQHLRARRIDAHHPRAELHRHLGAPARDQRAQALGHRILRLGLGLAQEVARRQLAELDTRFQRPDHGIGQPLQRILRHQHAADRHIGALLQGLDQLARGIDGDLLEACVFLLGRLGAADVDRLLQAVGHRPRVHLFQDRHGGIAAAGLDPLGAEIEGKTEGGAVSDGTAADALARLDHQHALVRRHQAFGGGKARDTGPDDDDVGLGGPRRKRCSCHQGGQEETTTERHLADSVCYRAVDGVAFVTTGRPWSRPRAARCGVGPTARQMATRSSG